MKKTVDFIRYVLIILCGNMLFAFAVAGFIIPSNILVGGVTGVGIVLNHTLGVDTALFVLLANVILMLAGWALLGKKFFLSTAASSVLYPVFLSLLQRVPAVISLTDNPLLSAVFAGVLLGAAIGMLMREGSSSGGTDIIGLIVHKYTHISVAVTVWLSDILVIGAQAFLSSSESLLLGIVTIVLESLVLDRVMLLGKPQLQVFAVSREYERLRNDILKEMNVGVTMTVIETGLTGERQMAVMCVIHPRKLYDLTALIQSVDAGAFITVTKIQEVHGQGFTRERIPRRD